MTTTIRLTEEQRQSVLDWFFENQRRSSDGPVTLPHHSLVSQVEQAALCEGPICWRAAFSASSPKLVHLSHRNEGHWMAFAAITSAMQAVWKHVRCLGFPEESIRDALNQSIEEIHVFAIPTERA